MIKINILTLGLVSPNSYGFLYPIYRNKKILIKNKVHIKIFYDYDIHLLNCDILILDSKYFGKNFWKKKLFNEGINFIQKLKSNNLKIIYYDNSDSTGWIHAHVIDSVDTYAKSQILKNTNLYKKIFYNNRYYCDYYNRKFNIENKNILRSTPLTDIQIKKIRLGWNSSLADYSFFGNILMRFNRYTKINRIFEKKINFYSLKKENNRKIFLRMGVSYEHDTISYHRQSIQNEVLNNIDNKIPINKINRFGYFNELKKSFLAVSPFGLGELTLKDYECILYKVLIIKPDISHMETFPNLFENNITYLPFKWDNSNLCETIEYAFNNQDIIKKIVDNMQKKYNYFLNTHEGNNEFVKHFLDMINK